MKENELKLKLKLNIDRAGKGKRIIYGESKKRLSGELSKVRGSLIYKRGIYLFKCITLKMP